MFCQTNHITLLAFAEELFIILQNSNFGIINKRYFWQNIGHDPCILAKHSILILGEILAFAKLDHVTY